MRNASLAALSSPSPSPTPSPRPRRTPRSPSAFPAGPASRRSRSPRRPASSRRTARRDDQEDSAEGPPSRDRVRRRPVRGDDRRDLRRVERQRRADHAGRAARQVATAPTAWPCATTSPRSPTSRARPCGVDAPGTSPYFGLAWILKKNGLSMKDVTVATMSPQAAAQAFVAGQNDAAMTYEPYLSSVRDKPGGRQDHRDHARLPDGDGHVRLHAQVHQGESEGRQGDGRQLLRGAGDDQEGSGEELRDHGRRREADRRAVREVGGVSALAGQGGEPEILRRRDPGVLARNPPTCCSKSASSSRCRTSNTLVDTQFIK